MNVNKKYDCLVIGSGMGGITAASLLANDGYKVLVLEAAHLPGGCSSSYKKKGYVFESGATTLIGFDKHQPLFRLEKKLGITIPKAPVRPPMTVHLGGETVTRYQSNNEWLREAVRVFGNPRKQEKFWKLAGKISRIVWELSGKNPAFPPRKPGDILKLAKNNPAHLWILRYAFRSVKDVALSMGLDSPGFLKFLDEQLIISAQSKSKSTPFLFGAAALTYTNYTNYYVPGGLLNMIRTLESFLRERGGELLTRSKVAHIAKAAGVFEVVTVNGESYRAPVVISGVPVWNMPELTNGEMSAYFQNEADKYSRAWGAVTMGVVTGDVYPEGFPLHHQIHLQQNDRIFGIESESLFVSLSKRGDEERAPAGKRVLNVSAHAVPGRWFSLNGDYNVMKSKTESSILSVLKKRMPHFKNAEIEFSFSATPVTWQKWVHRSMGRVGGIPQSMSRSLTDWTANETPFRGLYMCGDTVFPGQGIPGVTLSGFNVYYRVNKNHSKEIIR